MNREQIVEALTPLARQAFSEEGLVLRDDLTPGNVTGWTSLSFMQLLGMVESSFGIKFKIMELVAINSMGDFISAIERHVW